MSCISSGIRKGSSCLSLAAHLPRVSSGDENALSRGTLLPCDLSKDRATMRLGASRASTGMYENSWQSPGDGCGVGTGRVSSFGVVGGHHQPSRRESELQKPPGHPRARLQCWALLHGHCFARPHATLGAVQCYPEHLLLLFPWGRKKALEVGVVPHMFFLRIGCSRARLLRLSLWCQAAKSLHHFMEQQSWNHCLDNLGVHTPHNTTLPLRLGASPKNLVWGLS